VRRGRRASQERIEVSVEKKALEVHRSTICQKLFMLVRRLELGVRRSALLGSMGRSRPWTM